MHVIQIPQEAGIVVGRHPIDPAARLAKAGLERILLPPDDRMSLVDKKHVLLATPFPAEKCRALYPTHDD